MCGRGRDGQAILFFTSKKFFIPKIYPPYINSVSNSLPIAQTNTSALPARLKQTKLRDVCEIIRQANQQLNNFLKDKIFIFIFNFLF